jgi:hypothetical protein
MCCCQHCSSVFSDLLLLSWFEWIAEGTICGGRLSAIDRTALKNLFKLAAVAGDHHDICCLSGLRIHYDL